ncbi:MAG: YgiQ family radical SAM protein [Bacteroidota bacterium]
MKKPPFTIKDWLPVSKDELLDLGWDYVDIILVSGDAYVDHPSFGTAVIGRVLEHAGYRVAILPQPNWRDDLRDFKKLGKPRLFFGVTSGCMDSMVNHYTAAKRLRSDDAYTADDKSGFRPDYATYVYTKILKELFPDVPVILGGIEASLRRFTHYDYWSDTLKPSILCECPADLLVYGMGEKTILTIAQELKNGKAVSSLDFIPQTAFISQNNSVKENENAITLPSHEACVKDKKVFAKMFCTVEEESNRMDQKRMIQLMHGKTIVVNPSLPVAESNELDSYFNLPYTRLPHPRYKKRGVIPAYEMIRHSVTMHRGCFGGCSFCTISAHQGKFISSRSESSILNELEAVVQMEDFKGYVSDLGGPTANMYRMKGIEETKCKKCKRPSCIFPSVCANLDHNHKPLMGVYEKARQIKGIKKVFIGSGIRYDLFTGFESSVNQRFGLTAYAKQLIIHHVSGRLKVAPEHTEPKVLKLMRKTDFEKFVLFKKHFDEVCVANALNQQVIPYFISCHPGCDTNDMKTLSEKTGKMGFHLEQVQMLTPTPMTLSSVMYYTGLDPYTGTTVFVARSKNDKEAQHSYFFNKDKKVKK